MTTKIFTSYEDFSKREDKTINGVSVEFASQNPNFENDNTKEQELLGKIAKHSRIFVLPEIKPLNGE